MNPIKEIDRTTRDRFPLALHANLQLTFYTLIHPIAPEKLLLNASDIDTWHTGILDEMEIAREAKTAEETAELRKRDEARSKIAAALIQEIRLADKSPIEANHAPGHRLRIIVNTYKGLPRESFAAKTAHIKALLHDLDKPAAVADLALLKLSQLVQMLRTANNDFDALFVKRLSFDAALKNLPSTTSVRRRNDATAYAIFRHIEAAYLTAATEEYRQPIGNLIDLINAAIHKTKATYSQSIAQKRAAAERKKKKEEGEDGDEAAPPSEEPREADADGDSLKREETEWDTSSTE